VIKTKTDQATKEAGCGKHPAFLFLPILPPDIESKGVSQGVSQEWREVKGGLGWFRSLSARGTWDRLKQEGLTDVAHLGKEQFQFSMLSNSVLKELGLVDR
jgi:hypothetical protein